MEFGAFINANCEDGYEAAPHEEDVRRFVEQVRG